HAAGECLGLSLRSADQRDRRAYFAAAFQDRQGLRSAAAPYHPRRRLHDPRRHSLNEIGVLLRRFLPSFWGAAAAANPERARDSQVRNCAPYFALRAPRNDGESFVSIEALATARRRLLRS